MIKQTGQPLWSVWTQHSAEDPAETVQTGMTYPEAWWCLRQALEKNNPYAAGILYVSQVGQEGE